MKNKIIAVDFDGTLCVDEYPNIGAPRRDVIEALKKERRNGARVILWTCRSGKELKQALYWLCMQGVNLDAVNRNLPENITEYGGDSRKIYADEYWDDKAVLPFDQNKTAAGVIREMQQFISDRISEYEKMEIYKQITVELYYLWGVLEHKALQYENK